MRGPGHHLTGLAAGIAFAPSNPAEAALVIVGGWLGGTAPDWLEIRFFGKRLISHRRITHWLLAWVALFVAAQLNGYNPLLAGFALGGLAHCLGDLPNPTGIPVLHPWERSSLNWWKSGQYDWLISAVALSGAWLYRSA